MVRVKVKISISYISEKFIFGGEVFRRGVSVLSGRAKSFSNAVIKCLAVGSVDWTSMRVVIQMSQS